MIRTSRATAHFLAASVYRIWRACRYISISWGKKLVRPQQICPWVLSLSVLIVQREAAVRDIMIFHRGVVDRVDKPFKFSVCSVLWVSTHKIVLPLQSIGVLRGWGGPAVHLLAARLQRRLQDIFLSSRPLPDRKCTIDSCNADISCAESGVYLRLWIFNFIYWIHKGK